MKELYVAGVFPSAMTSLRLLLTLPDAESPRMTEVSLCCTPGGGGYSYIFPYGDVPLNRVSFSGFQLRDRVHIFIIFDSERSF